VPSSAKRQEIRIKYLPSKKLMLELLYNFRFSMADNQDENRIPLQNESITQFVRGSAKYSLSEYLTLSTRVDYKIVNPAKSRGFLLLQDINFRFRRFPVSIWMRHSIFNTGSFESGLYTWEDDLLNSYSIPVLYGIGNHSYIMASWKIPERAELRIKYGVTGTSVINGNMKIINEFKIQFRIRI
jgi:hypothetical protein